MTNNPSPPPPVEPLSEEVLNAHRTHLGDDLKKIADMGRSIESYPWLMRERDLHQHIDALCQSLRVARAEIERLNAELTCYCRCHVRVTVRQQICTHCDTPERRTEWE